MPRTVINVDPETKDLVKQARLWNERGQGQTVKRIVQVFLCAQNEHKCTIIPCEKHRGTGRK